MDKRLFELSQKIGRHRDISEDMLPQDLIDRYIAVVEEIENKAVDKLTSDEVKKYPDLEFICEGRNRGVGF